MTGLEYMNTVCPTTSNGKDPNREDVADAFEDGIAEGFRQHWKPTEKQLECLKEACDEHFDLDGLNPLYTLYEQLKALV